jgi:hypothetical protein
MSMRNPREPTVPWGNLYTARFTATAGGVSDGA